MTDDDTTGPVDRRNVLKGAAGLGVAGLAGCLGGDDEIVEIVAGCSSRGSTSFSSCQAMQAVADRHSENLEFTVTAPGGDPASIRGLDEGEVDLYTSGSYIVQQAAAGNDPFADDPVDGVGGMVMSYITIDMYMMQKEEAGYEDFQDAIDQEADIWGFPAGWGLRRLFMRLLEEAGMREEVEPLLQDMAAEDVAGALEEDRVEVFTGYGNSGVGLAGWEVEVDSRVDVEWLEMPDRYWDGVEAGPALLNQIPPYGWEQDINSPDEFNAWVDGFNMYADEDLSSDVVYELLELATEYPDELRDAEPNWLDGNDPENLTVGFWDTELHPGAAEFFDDHDVDISPAIDPR